MGEIGAGTRANQRTDGGVGALYSLRVGPQPGVGCEEEHHSAVGELGQNTTGAILLHRGATLAASRSCRRDVRRTVGDDAACTRVVIETAADALQAKPDGAVGLAGGVASESIQALRDIQSKRRHGAAR